jgi:hypothetical protein
MKFLLNEFHLKRVYNVKQCGQVEESCTGYSRARSLSLPKCELGLGVRVEFKTCLGRRTEDQTDGPFPPLSRQPESLNTSPRSGETPGPYTLCKHPVPLRGASDQHFICLEIHGIGNGNESRKKSTVIAD